MAEELWSVCLLLNLRNILLVTLIRITTTHGKRMVGMGLIKALMQGQLNPAEVYYKDYHFGLSFL